MTTLSGTVVTAVTSSKPLLERPNPSFSDVLRTTARKLSEIEQRHAELEGIPKLAAVHRLDSDTKDKISGASDKMSSFMHVLANEPSIGLYHVSNHVTRSVPKCVETKRKLRETTKSLEDLSYDMDYTLTTIKDLKELNTFTSIRQLLASSITTIHSINQGVPPQRFPARSPQMVQASSNALLPHSYSKAEEVATNLPPSFSTLSNNNNNAEPFPEKAHNNNFSPRKEANEAQNDTTTTTSTARATNTDNDILKKSAGGGGDEEDASRSLEGSTSESGAGTPLESSGNQEGAEDVLTTSLTSGKKKRKGKDGKKKRKDFTMKTFEI